MNINKSILLSECRSILHKMRKRRSSTNGARWCDVVDFSFVDYLLETIINTNPIENCRVVGSVDDWNGLPVEKSLYHAPIGCGLPIGNLSSQLFSNVYMNVFDQYVKRQLRCAHYGRYVDDAFVVSGDSDYLRSLIPQLSAFLEYRLHLKIHPNKTQIYNARYGVEFLGAFIKPFRTYVSSSSLRRMARRMKTLPMDNALHLESSVNSYLGVMSHYDCYCLRRVMWGYLSGLSDIGKFDSNWLKFRIE